MVEVGGERGGGRGVGSIVCKWFFANLERFFFCPSVPASRLEENLKRAAGGNRMMRED